MRVPLRTSMDTKKHADVVEFITAVPQPLRGGYVIEGLKLLKEKMTCAENGEKKPVDFANLIEGGKE